VRAAWLVVVLLAGCGGGDEEAAKTDDTKTGDTKVEKKPEPAKESEARKALFDAWEKAGLKAADMKASDLLGKDCKQGTVNKVDVVVCEFANADEAKKAEAKGLEWVGDTTGAAWTSGTLVVAVADRKKADANGKAINAMMKTKTK
jgi:hypothetical protein